MSRVRSFVVQKHDARRLHYDFRLELDGVLKSWAIPKGPSLSPRDKRLAVMTDDHPLDYRDFEGTIPAGEPGGGPVIVWDRGSWEPIGDPHEGLRKGRLDFVLDGDKLRGRYMLVRFASRRPNDKKDNWMLMKRSDEHVREGKDAAIVTREPRSVLTGRTIEDVAAGAPEPDAAKLPAFGSIAPELATLVDDVPSGAAWVHEIKYDGYRILAYKDGARVRLASRSGKDWTRTFPEIAEALAHVRAATALFDGEIAWVLENGRTDFQSLQNGMKAGNRTRIVYFVFDLLHVDGADLTKDPLTARKDKLRTILAGEEPPLRLGGHLAGDGRAFLREACARGLEGLVSKRADAPYRAGRGRDWRKVKCQQRQEMVVVGFTPPRGSRAGLGALLLAVAEDGGYRYAGKVGTGFTQASLADLRARLGELVTDTPPARGAPRLRGATWVKPALVAQIRFTEWTRDGALRHPSFEGLREDKPPAEVRREVSTKPQRAPPD
jgi:bifunctional non-homologous end joining protein LigD